MKAQTPPFFPNNKKFGWFFSAVFSMLAIYSHWHSWNKLAFFAFTLAIFFAFSALVAPKILGPLNRLWFELGLLLGKIMSPIVLGIIFFVMITPISLIMRLFGRDELKMKQRIVDSYWVNRSPPGPPSESFKNQY